MYSLLLMTAMAGTPDAAAFGNGCHGCYGGCFGGISYSCSGCFGSGCFGSSCFGSSCYGSGCFGSSCSGCSGYMSCSGGYGGCHGSGRGGFLKRLFHHKSSCHGSSYSSCYGSYSSCYGSSCHGSYLSCFGGCSGSCYGSCYGSGLGVGCYGGCYGSVGSSFGCIGAAPVVGAPVIGAPATSGYVPYTAPATGATPPATGTTPPATGTTPPATGTTPPATGTGTSGGSTSAAAPAALAIDLPADAKLYVDGAPTAMTGATRHFHTPALPAGQAFFYELKAEVVVNGRTEVEEKQVIVRAGEAVAASFPRLVAAVAQEKGALAAK